MAQWLEALDDLSDKQFVVAMKAFARESTDFPTPAAVRRYAGLMGLRDDERAKQAWFVVEQTIRDRGAYVSIDFTDRFVNAAIRAMGGWERLCGADPQWMHVTEKRFIETYCLLTRTGLGDGSPLVGIAERSNGGSKAPPLKVAIGLPVRRGEQRLKYTPAELPLIEQAPTRKVSDALAARMRDLNTPRPTRLEVAVLDDEERQRLKQEKVAELREWIKRRQEGRAAFVAACAAVGKETQQP
jgi:hypothetical protein